MAPISALLIGLTAATYLHWPALVSPVHYLSDIRQCLNWVAYHSDSFQDDDLLVSFAEHNEALFQNILYWLGTWFVDPVFPQQAGGGDWLWFGSVALLLSRKGGLRTPRWSPDRRFLDLLPG